MERCELQESIKLKRVLGSPRFFVNKIYLHKLVLFSLAGLERAFSSLDIL